MVSWNSPKNQTNEFVFTGTKNLFARFLGEYEDTKKSFRNSRKLVRYIILPVAWIFEAMAPMGVSSLMDAVNTF